MKRPCTSVFKRYLDSFPLSEFIKCIDGTMVLGNYLPHHGFENCFFANGNLDNTFFKKKLQQLQRIDWRNSGKKKRVEILQSSKPPIFSSNGAGVYEELANVIVFFSSKQGVCMIKSKDDKLLHTTILKRAGV